MDYQSNALLGAFSFIFLIIGLVGLGTLIISVIAMWRLFEKAGKPGWASIIPIYSSIVLLEIIGKPTIWILWLLIPCTSPIFAIWSLNLLMKSFGKDEGYTIGVLFLPFIFLPMLAFGNNPYLGPSAAEARGFYPPNGFGTKDPFNQPPTPPQV